MTNLSGPLICVNTYDLRSNGKLIENFMLESIYHWKGSIASMYWFK